MGNEKMMNGFCNQMADILELIQHMFKNATKNIEITHIQFMFMKTIQIYQHMSIGKIVKTLGWDQGNVSNMCKKLEKKGWISRERNPLDERVVLVSLTQQGEDILNRIQEYNEKQMNRIFDILSEEEVKMAEMLFSKILTSYQKLIYEKEVSECQNSV